MILVTLIAYLVLQFGLCFYLSRKIKTEADYFVAGRGFSWGIVSISLFATWFGVETCIGSSGAVYAEGLSGSRSDPFGYSLCLFLAGLLIAGRFWSKKFVTLADFYRQRFGSRVENISVWIIAISSLIWAAAQIRAFGQVIDATAGVGFQLAMFLGFVFVVSYTLLGGLMGDMVTDVVQAVVICGGLLLILFSVVSQIPDLPSAIQAIPSERLSLVGKGETWLTRIETWSIPIFGSLIAQEIIARILSAKNAPTAVKGCYVGGSIYLVFGLIPVVLGLLGPGLIQVEGDSEQFLLQLSREQLSPVLTGIFTGALVSALLATIDSILLAVGALVTHNFVIPRFQVKRKLLVSRMVVFMAGLVAYLMAVKSESIFNLLEAASSFGGAGILVITLAGLWSRVGNEKAALAAVIAGVLTPPVAEYVLELPAPFLTSILTSTLAYAAFAVQRNSFSRGMGFRRP